LSRACLGKYVRVSYESLQNEPVPAGVVSRANGGSFEIRSGTTPKAVPASDREASYLVLNRKQCNPVRKKVFWTHFPAGDTDIKNDHYTKTGSGQA